MNRLFITLIKLFIVSFLPAQSSEIDRVAIKKDFDQLLFNISEQYVYLENKNVDLDCIKSYYGDQIKKLKTEEETVLFFEYILNEFYDSHIILNTNRNSSFRLFSPIYASLINGKAIVTNVWQTQIEKLNQNIIGAEVLKINEINVNTSIKNFPSQCNDKHAQGVREWILNKVLAGRYNEPRILTLKLITGEIVQFDLDHLKIKKESTLVHSSIQDDIGIIRINNSLGNNELIEVIDNTLDTLMNTKGLIIDLRNTVDGGNSYVARGIMSRFIKEPKPYQRHFTIEKYGDNPEVERSWVEYVSPRKEQYTKPLVILVGRWTGSMGEGLAIGFECMERGHIVGTEMERLAGGMSGFDFSNRNYGYRLSTVKLFHVDGTPREEYVPGNYVEQTTIAKDEVLNRGVGMIEKLLEY